jgi:hypothetical protein
VYGRAEAHDLIRRSQEDYRARFGRPADQLAAMIETLAPVG